jgi:TolB-like protein
LAGELRSRPKGADLLSRIPQGNQFTVAPLGIGDKILVSTAQLTLAAHEEGRSVREIEKLALYFFAVHSSFRSARELRHRAAQCAQRMPVSDDRVRYDYLFLAGDPENKRFWNESEELRKGLEDSFVRVESGLPPPSGPSRASEPRTLRLEPASEVRTAPRIAVLPLANISPDPKDEYFADGLTEELISVLSQIRGLRVIARTSVSQYKATVKPVSQIGAELGVSSILEGSVRKADSQLRVTVQLIDVGTEEHRWSQSYDRKLENVFAIQAEIAERTAEALKVELLRSEREAIQEKPTSNLAAYESYLRGIQAFRHESEAFETGRSVERDAEKHFEEAFRIDPQFAGAYSYLANHLLAVMAITRPAQDVVPRVRELVAKALELNPNSSDAHAALGNLAFQGDLDWTRAEAEFQQAIVLNPSSSTARFWYGYLLWALQRFPESKKQYLAAIELDPLWLLPRLNLAGEIFDAGDLPTAITECERLREKFGDSSTVRWSLAFYYAIAGRFKDAFALVESLKGATDPDSRARRSMILTQLGMPNELREFLADVEHGRVPEYLPLAGTAALHALLGEKEIALDLLNRDYREGDRALWGAYQGTFFDGLRDDPRFVALLEEYRLPKRLTRPLVGPSP